MSDEAVSALARAAGLAEDWTDATGVARRVAVESLRMILAALGFPCADDAQCRESLARIEQQRSAQTLPPLITAVVGQAIELPSAALQANQHYRIEFEEGGAIDGQLPIDGTPFFRLPAIDQPGYHRLTVDDQAITLAVAPLRCYGVADAVANSRSDADPHSVTRIWGLAVQLYSLRRHGDGGIGDFTALRTFAEHAAAQGAGAVAISPVHAMFSADVHRFSPYGPSSRLFLNALHVDPAAVAGEVAYRSAVASLGTETAARLAHLEEADLVDWPQAGSIRLDLLRALYRRVEQDAAAQAELAAFRAAGGEALEAHARFEALHAAQLAQGSSGYWRDWPEAYRHPHNPAVEAFAQAHAAEIDFHVFLQWQAARGLAAAQKAARDAGMPIGLIADLAVGADNGGSQAWSRQEEILTGLSVGAPPDQLNARGQSWGLGAFSPYAMKEKGFQAYIEMLRAVFAHAGGVRIDHVLGLGRLWLVPDGQSSAQGAYLRYPIDDLMRLIALESWRHRAVVIGEDLGTVPPGFDTRLAQAGLLGIRVLFFQRDEAGFYHPSHWSGEAMATTTTHDLPTVAGWWQGIDIGWRTRLDLLAADEDAEALSRSRDVDRAKLWRAFTDTGCAKGALPPPEQVDAPVDAAIGFVAATPAPLALIPAEDLLALPEQPNLPGTVDTHPNWRRRLPATVDALFSASAVHYRLALLKRLRPTSGAR